jgi:pyridoxal phosphate enzyme (YggS family)
MSIRANLECLRSELPSTVTLVAVSKFHPKEALLEAYEAGQRVFGESRVQELVEKQAALPKDIEWHLIGHLQTNKVKQVVPFISLIHSVDSLKLLQEINKEAARIDRVVPCLLQLHIAQEEQKFGFTLKECRELLSDGTLINLKHIRIQGVMGMATLTDNESEINKEFKTLRAFFDDIKQALFPSEPQFKVVSMGMSDDYPLAVQAGSTMIRVGSLIFGDRQY